VREKKNMNWRCGEGEGRGGEMYYMDGVIGVKL
jgi:hypothetical protein